MRIYLNKCTVVNHLFNPLLSAGKLTRIDLCEKGWRMGKWFLLTLFYACISNSVQANTITFHYSILGGELSNSAATSVEDICEVMPRMKAIGLNTVLVPVYWELLEPRETVFDFSLVDCTIDEARKNELKVIFLWFGAWKNSMSCYAPGWFKQDTKRFPRAMTKTGKTLEIASCFSENVLQADLRAFTELMRHIAEKDRDMGTVIMMQIENEIGMLEDARDHSPMAEKAYQTEIPQKLLKVLKIQKATWNVAYGDDPYGEEKFMAWHYACYVELLAQAARRVMPKMPLYVNAALNSRGRKPGEYPSAGPLAHLVDIWHCGAPSIDMLSPDIYDTGFKGWAAQYALSDNQLFIPETRCCVNSGVRAMYSYGEHHALGFSPFAIDQTSLREIENITNAYALLRQLDHVKGIRKSWGLLFDQEDKERVIDDDGVVMTCRHYFTLPWDTRATDGSTWLEGGAMLLRLGKYDYLLAGSGVVVDFKTPQEKHQEGEKQLGEDGFAITAQKYTSDRKTEGYTRLGLLSVDEVTVGDDGSYTFLRRHNGDQTHQGRHVRISVGDWKILHIRLYEYP